MIGFIFPGQGSQYIGMGREVYNEHPLARETFEQASSAINVDIRRLVFEGTEDVLELTENAQPAILTVSIALLRVFKRETAKRPDVIAGHSLGEYSGFVASGGMDFMDAVKVVRERGKFMQSAVPDGDGGMAAILGLSLNEVEEICNEVKGDGVLTPSNINLSDQIVISGNIGLVTLGIELAKKRGAKRAIMLKVSAPFHCSLMEPARIKLSDVLDRVKLNDMRIPLISNVTADLVRDSEQERELLKKQVASPVLWYHSMKRMVETGVDEVYEVGPGRVLSGLIKRAYPGLRAINIEDTKDIRALQG